MRTVLHNFVNFGKNINMIKVNQTINTIKEAVKALSGIYPSLFTVSPFDKNFLGKTAYSYSEILCGRVKIQEKLKEGKLI